MTDFRAFSWAQCCHAYNAVDLQELTAAGVPACGHMLLTGAPGTGKTALATQLASAVSHLCVLMLSLCAT